MIRQLSLFLLATTALASAQTYNESGGLVVMETENTESPLGLWHFNTPGKYWIWARAYCTGSEDNGMHFGINGAWPPSAQRWQTVTRNQWHWKSAQRTEKVHVGVPGILTLDVPSAGEHTIQISMREDGIELDKILLVNRKEYEPKGLGPEPVLKAGKFPKAFEFVKAEPAPIPEKKRSARPDGPALVQPRQPDGDGTVKLSGELKAWHKVTLELSGPFGNEKDNQPNVFTDHDFTVTFRHSSGSPAYKVPGYFAADGDAANSSAESGTVWRAHLSPDKPGEWTYEVSFKRGPGAALGGKGKSLTPFDGKSGSFRVEASDKQAPDLRARGRLEYVGRHHLRFAGDGSWFLKAGADAPETLFGYKDFDGTRAHKPGKVPLKSFAKHVRDWKPGDPVWQGGKGKGLVGAINYLSGKGMNAFSFLPYNAGGDGDNVWPFIEREFTLNYDCSKLDQWGIALEHGTRMGMFLHFKLQETENDDLKGPGAEQALDGGDCGPERKLYLREMIARFGHNLALNWNLGEENTQSFEQQKAMIAWIRKMDAYGHPIVLHTYPQQQQKVYGSHLGKADLLDGLSLQNSNVRHCHHEVVKWCRESAKAGKPWVVNFDEPGDAGFGMPPDDGYANMAALRKGPAKKAPTVDDVRKYTLWGTILAGGGGVEYYFGYKLPENDLIAEDWRSRDLSWDYARHALEFFRDEKIPFQEMSNRDELIGNPKHDNSRYCFAKDGEIYLVYLPTGGSTAIELPEGKSFKLAWFNPRTGEMGKAAPLRGRSVTAPDGDDWLAVIR